MISCSRAASSFFTAATSSSRESLMPTETPASDFSRVPPSSLESGHGFFVWLGFPDGSFASSLRHVWPRTWAEKVPDFGGRTKFPFL